jgi:hypothetical protein
MMPSLCRQVKWETVGFLEWIAQFPVCKTTGKNSFETCAIACQNCTVYSVFPSGMTSHSKLAQFNWECMGRFRSRVTVSYRRQAITPDIFIRTYSTFCLEKIRHSGLNFRALSFFRPNNISGVWLASAIPLGIRSSRNPATELPSVARNVHNAKRKGRIRPEDTGFGPYPVQNVW